MAVKKFPSYTNPKLSLQDCAQKGGYGLFAQSPIAKGELLCGWSGEIYTADELVCESEARRTHGLQISEELYLLPLARDNNALLDPSDYFNHSCDPNAGLEGQICLVAMRDIEPGEEVCFDYAMSDSSSYDEFDCHCGAPNCRIKVTGNDWKLPELQQRYRGYFIPYLQRLIDQLQAS